MNFEKLTEYINYQVQRIFAGLTQEETLDKTAVCACSCDKIELIFWKKRHWIWIFTKLSTSGTCATLSHIYVWMYVHNQITSKPAFKEKIVFEIPIEYFPLNSARQWNSRCSCGREREKKRKRERRERDLDISMQTYIMQLFLILQSIFSLSHITVPLYR